MINRLFREHLEFAGESYLQHARYALCLALRLVLIACAAVIHALVPGVFEVTASNKVAKLHQELERRSDDRENYVEDDIEPPPQGS